MMEELAAYPDTRVVMRSWQRCSCGNKTPWLRCCGKHWKNDEGLSPQTLLLQLMHLYIKVGRESFVGAGGIFICLQLAYKCGF